MRSFFELGLTLSRYEEAAYAATRALTLDPKNSEARYVRGVARMEQRLLKPARMDFETVLAHDPLHFLARAALTEVTHFIETSGHLGAHALAADPVEALTEGVDFGFPHYDQDALEIASVSDSSDCAHVGNGVQCRFYNHEGCARSNACAFSHAPDEKSVRDDLCVLICAFIPYMLTMHQGAQRLHVLPPRLVQVRRGEVHLLALQGGATEERLVE